MSSASPRWVSKCGSIELRQGRWQDVLSDVTACDAVITDPPYSPRIHSGFRTNEDYLKTRVRSGAGCGGRIMPGGIPYEPITKEVARELVRRLLPRWWVIFGDHISFRIWEESLADAGWYTFAPVVWLTTGKVRFQGDGPSSDCEYICIARPKRKTQCGSLPGHYAMTHMRGNDPNKLLKGQKPIALMQEIVRDYTSPNDLVVEPFAGSATTLLACAIEGRRCLGAEQDPETFRKAVKRLSAGWTVDFTARLPKPKQGDLGI